LADVRYAEYGDYDRVEEIAKEVHELHVSFRPDLYKGAPAVMERAYFNDLVSNGLAIVAEAGGEMLGFTVILIKTVSHRLMQSRRVLYVDTMAVKNGSRHKGIGSSMFAFLIRLAKSEGCDAIELSVNERNEDARRTYEKWGLKVKLLQLEMKLDQN